MARFTVVMATYNRGRHILPSIRSVLAQGFADFELAVVGDCCDDETAGIVAAIDSPKIRWHNLAERCGSQSFPNNAGIAMARGDLVAYLGHDDIWAPDHLAALAALFERNPQLDFAVAGAIFHGAPGSDFRQVTGIFDDSRAPFEHFFPPSGFAHRRDVTDRIGPWLPPHEVRAPVDSDFLLRAAHAGMRFASTGRVTAHKFAAGHRYLSYLRPASDEQDAMLGRMAAPGYETFLAAEMAAARAAGTFMAVRYSVFENFEKGEMARRNAGNKGISLPALRPLERRETIRQDAGPRAQDWRSPPADHPAVRFVDRNPRPKVLIPFTAPGPVRIELQLVHADAAALRRLAVTVNGEAARVRLSGAEPRGGLHGATAPLVARLDASGYTVLQLELERSQRPLGGGRGLGMADIVIQPVGAASRLSAILGGYLAPFRSRPDAR